MTLNIKTEPLIFASLHDAYDGIEREIGNYARFERDPRVQDGLRARGATKTGRVIGVSMYFDILGMPESIAVTFKGDGSFSFSDEDIDSDRLRIYLQEKEGDQ